MYQYQVIRNGWSELDDCGATSKVGEDVHHGGNVLGQCDGP